MTTGRIKRTGALALMALTTMMTVGAGKAARADAVADYYGGKRITAYASSRAGGGFDLYVRLLSRHIGRHIPGKPSVVATNMPGAGGLVLTNWLYNKAPKDGSAIALIPAYVLLQKLYGNKKALFDPERFIWLGNMNTEVDHCSVWHTTGIKGPEDFFKRQVILGASGTGAGSFTVPTIMNEVMGTKFKVILGYSSGKQRSLAMEQGEIDGQCGTYLSSVKANSMQLVKSGQLRLIWQVGHAAHPDFPTVPLAIDYAKTDKAKRVLNMFFSTMAIGRALALPPGVPAARVAALRTAFNAAVRDDKLQGEAKKANMELRTMTADTMKPFLDTLLKEDPALYAETARVLKIGGKSAPRRKKAKDPAKK